MTCDTPNQHITRRYVMRLLEAGASLADNAPLKTDNRSRPAPAPATSGRSTDQFIADKALGRKPLLGQHFADLHAE